MITRDTLFRMNPNYKIWSIHEFIEEYPELKSSFSSNQCSFFLTQKNHMHPDDCIPLNLATLNCLLACEEPTTILQNEFIDINFVKKLVLDHILQIQKNDGEYISGPTCFLTNDTIIKKVG